MLNLLVACVLTGSGAFTQPEAERPDPKGEEPTVERVGGEAEAEIEEREGPEGPLYRAGRVFTDTKLPVGYPRPTPPGAIEIKTYPSIRQAEVSGEGTGDSASRSGFWPLFQHISRNEIAMTAPVEMRYSDNDGDEQTDEWTMAFLYHVPDNGPTGTDEADSRVEVIDTEPVTVVALGIRGGQQVSNSRAAESILESWIDSSGEWRRAGDTRRLGYNGPNVRPADRWWEIQIPIEPVDADDTEEGI